MPPWFWAKRGTDLPGTDGAPLVDAVPSRLADGVVLRDTRQKGYGLFAIRRFAIGEIVLAGADVRRIERNDTHAVQIGREEFGHEEGLGSWVNHSCDPNCGIRPSEEGVFDLVARQAIWRDDEVTIDYAMRNYVIEFFPPICRCGVDICRGQVTGWKDLGEERRRAYEGSVAPYLHQIEAEKTPAIAD
jgi:hypothetical protein